MKVRYDAGRGNGSRPANRKSTVALVFATAALLLSGTSVAVNWDRVKATYGKAHSALVGRQAPKPGQKEAPEKSMAAPISPPEAKEGSALEQTNEEWFEELFEEEKKPAPSPKSDSKKPVIRILGEPKATGQKPAPYYKKPKKKADEGDSGGGGFAPPPTAVAGSTGNASQKSKPKGPTPSSSAGSESAKPPTAAGGSTGTMVMGGGSGG